MFIPIPRTFFFLTLMFIGFLTLGACFSIQYLGHIPPCPLCLYERIPYGILFCVSFLGLCFQKIPFKLLIWVLWITFLASVGLSFYHVAVEYKIFPTPSTCLPFFSMDKIQTVQDFQAMLPSQPTFACNEVPVTFLKISLAAYNLLLSLGLLALLTLAVTFKPFIKTSQ